MLFSMLQRWGQTTFDTKFDLTAAPGPFIARSLHLWNQQSSFGELQNQAYGYIFPQGLFALLGDLLSVPDWVVQRLWSGLLLVIAFEGARRLWRALSPEAQPWTAQLAGLAFALSPRLLGLSGVLSAEVLPTAVAPWCVLPLVLAQTGRLSMRSGGLLAAVAVLGMGGVNAVENLAVLPLPLLVVLASCRRPGGGRLAAWWAGGVVAACSWWMLPLLVLGRYSPPFLDFVETSAATTRPLGWTNAVRGVDHWLAYVFVGGRSWWPGAYDLATTPHLIAVTALVAAISLAGLAHRAMPLRGALAASALIGLVCLTLAREGALAAPPQPLFEYLLNGPLAMLRNVHKVDPLVRLPLAMGLGQACVVLAAWRPHRGRRWLVPASLGIVGVLLVVSGQPLFDGRVRKTGWSSVPDAWSQATKYLSDHSDGRATLVAPGSGFGQQWWGWTIDEPIQGLARTPWVTRSQVPLTPGGTIRFLDSIEERNDDGVGSPQLGNVLARSGVGWVLVRRDLDLYASGAPSPGRIDLALQHSSGLRKVAGFGASGFGDQALIDVYRVLPPAARVEAVALSGVRTLYGGPEDLLTAMEAGALPADAPVVMVTRRQLGQAAPDIVGDGYRLRERQFGRSHDAVGQIMANGEQFRSERAAHDYPGVPGVERVHARYDVIKALSASSSAGYADTLGASQPELGPYAAFDGLHSTFWQSAPFLPPTKQWLEVRFDKPRLISQVDVVAGVDGVNGVPVRQIRVDVGPESVKVAVNPNNGEAKALLRTTQRVDRVRVAVTKTAGTKEVVSIREVSFPGLALNRRLVVPDSGAGSQTSFVLRARPHRSACIASPIGPACDVQEGRTSEEERGLARELTLKEPGTWRLSGDVVALPGAATHRLLEPLAGRVRVRAPSVYAGDAAVSGQMAYDADPFSYWLADPSDKNPTLFLRWAQPRTLTRLQVTAPGGGAVPPVRALLRSGKQTREVDLRGGSIGNFAPLTTTHLRITFPRSPGLAEGTPVGVAELAIDGLDDLRHRIDKSQPTGAVCGIGPEVMVDSKLYPTRIDGTVGDVLTGSPLRLVGCGDDVDLAAGVHQLRLNSTSQFGATALTLTPSRAAEPAPVTRRSTEILTWTSNDRSVRVGPGPEALLRVPENINAGWRAELGGKTLKPVTIDGWQQGYELPSGQGGKVRLTFAPDGPYRAGLLIGGLLALALIAAAGWAWRRDSDTRSSRLSALMDLAPRRAPWSLPVLAVVLLLAYLLGGPAVAAGGLLAMAARRWLADPAHLVGPVFGLAGLGAAIAGSHAIGLTRGVFDVASGAAVGMLLIAVCTRPLRSATADE